MAVGETHSLRRQFVDVRCGDPAALAVVALDITVAEVISEEDKDVGFGYGPWRVDCVQRGGRREEEGEQKGGQCFHEWDGPEDASVFRGLLRLSGF